MSGRIYIVLIMSALCLVGCKHGRRYFDKDVPPYPVTIHRLDQAVLELGKDEFLTDSALRREKVDALYEKYPEFMRYWTEDILGINAEDTAYLSSVLPAFLQDTVYGFKQTNEVCAEQFASIRDLSESLSGAFGRARTFYDGPIPEVYFFISGFHQGLVLLPDGNIGVGVDLYLGSDYPLYNEVVYDYQKYTMRKECIPVDVVSAWLFRETPYTSDGNRLIDNMLYRGKVMYVVSLLFPEEKDWEVMGYSKEQWDWCKQHERAIWGWMMDRKDLFKTESLVLSSYLNDGPFTSEVSADSPGRLGTWMGWRIVESYMENNPEVEIVELLKEGDSQKILEMSHYKP